MATRATPNSLTHKNSHFPQLSELRLKQLQLLFAKLLERGEREGGREGGRERGREGEREVEREGRRRRTKKKKEEGENR